MEYKLEYLADDERTIFYLTKDAVVIGKLPENDIDSRTTPCPAGPAACSARAGFSWPT